MKTFRKLGLTVLACGIAGFVGCGGVGAGDHVVYRAAFGQTSYDSGCHHQDDGSSDVRGSSTIMVYSTGGDGEPVYWLDVGDAVFEGTESDDGWVFSGSSQQIDQGGNTTITTTTKTTITVHLDGSVINGTTKIVTSAECSGMCGGFDTESCTTSTDFTGVELDDASVGVDV